MRAFRVGLLAAVLAASTGFNPRPQPALAQSAAQTGLAIVPLTIAGPRKSHRFHVEVAQSDRQQAIGLMFRKRVAPDGGMIFPFGSPRPASFWMKNTLVPLDMLFIRANGTIAFIAANTRPLSLDPVGVDEPVSAVLELAGGRAAALGIREGDKVSWSRPHR